MSEVQFKRRVRLLLAHPIVGDFATAQPNAIEITELRVAFKVTKTLTKEPNTAEIEVSNMSRLLRQSLQVRDLRVILEAGYADHVAGVFVGDARTLDHTRDGADWTTRIRCGDGERGLALARVNTSFKTGTPLDDIMAKVTRPLGVSFDPAQFAGKQAVSGYAAHGRAADVMDRVITSAGLEWSIQDGRLQVVPKGGVTAEVAVELSADTGLIGSPEASAPDKKTKKIMLKGECLLAPRIRPGGRVSLRTEAHKGTFRVTKVTHEGDTHGSDWRTSFELEAL